jgi:organic radical activating enzyme
MLFELIDKMKIIEVKQRWPKDILRIEIMLGNTCNYKCWYCFPGSNEGTHGWPEYDQFVKNLEHLLTYYKENLDKKKFELHIIGGEPTIWSNFGRFIQHFKDNFDCAFSVGSNGSRTLRWWEQYGRCMDKVVLSCHHEKVDIDHFIKVADCLYDQGVIVTGLVLMDPNHWDRCLELVNKLKTSRRRWGINMQEIHHDNISYTAEQTEFLKKHVLRYPNPFWFFLNNKNTILKTSVVTEQGKTVSVKNNEIVLNKINNFYGWDCNLGVDSIFIRQDGFVAGACGNNLYNLDFQYNIKNKDFTEKFTPQLTSTTCNTIACRCQPESNLNKKLSQPVSLSSTVYPLHRYTNL